MTAAGWHPDPGGRHQFRWWDGASWTDQVADGNTVGTDPLPPAPGAPVVAAAAAAAKAPTPRSTQADAILDRTHLRFFSGGGGSTPPDWWAVRDAAGEKVARVWRRANRATMWGLDDGAVMGAVTRLGRRQPGKRSGDVAFGRNVMGIDLTDHLGKVWATRASFTAALDLTWNFAVDGEKLLKVKVDVANFSGSFQSAVLIDRATKQEIGRITEEHAEGRWGQDDYRSWLCVDRAPGLVDPMRSLVLSVPLALQTYLFRLGDNR